MSCLQQTTFPPAVHKSVYFLYLFTKLGANIILAFAIWIGKNVTTFSFNPGSFRIFAIYYKVLVPSLTHFIQRKFTELNGNPHTSYAQHIRCCVSRMGEEGREKESFILQGEIGVFKCVKIWEIWQFPELRLHQEASLMPTHKHLGSRERSKWCPPPSYVY